MKNKLYQKIQELKKIRLTRPQYLVCFLLLILISGFEAYLVVYYKNIFMHNLSEKFVYGPLLNYIGIAAHTLIIIMLTFTYVFLNHSRLVDIIGEEKIMWGLMALSIPGIGLFVNAMLFVMPPRH